MIHNAARFAGLLILIITLTFTGCEEDKSTPANAQREAQPQAQLRAEEARRLSVEQQARLASESKAARLTGLGLGACVLTLVVGALGVHIGLRAASRYRKEHPNG